MSSFNIAKLSADEFFLRELTADSREYTYTCKLAGNTLQTNWFPIVLSSATLVRKISAMKIGDTIEWGPITSLNITKLSTNEFLGREADGEEGKCVQTGEFLKTSGSIFPLYLNPKTISKLAQVKVGDTVTLYRVEDSERPIDCPLCGSPMCGATTEEWRIK